MKLLWSLALRNIFRNRRRTALNLCMIASGVTAILLFEGFTRHLVVSLRESTIRTQTSHIQIANTKFWESEVKKPKEGLLRDYPSLLAKVKAKPEVTYAAGKLSFFGLVSTKDQSVSARGISFDPALEKDREGGFQFVEGRPLSPETAFEVVLGRGLAKRLGAKAGDSLTLIANTYDGVINALDVEVAGVFQTGVAEFDDLTFLVPLTSAQRLLDTQDVEQILVGLKNTMLTDSVVSSLKATLASAHPGIQVKPWHEVAKLYNQISGFLRVQNALIALIIGVLTLFAISNTIGMSVFERTGEIGTIRALGETQGSVVKQFLREGFVLGALGSLIGLIQGVAIAAGLNAAGVEIIMPGASAVIKIHIELFFAAFVGATALSLFAATAAAFVSAWRASRLEISDALRRNVV
jgi:putative ABC transport system permease protein